jgi:hypothetical protein
VKLDLDSKLSNLSKTLFRIDETSIEIMEVISEKGPRSVSQLELDLSKSESNPSRSLIYRRLIGEGYSIGLMEYDYLTRKTHGLMTLPSENSKHTYSLRFKGLLASLAKRRLDHNYLGKPFFKDILERSNDTDLLNYSKNYIKSELALWLHLHLENGLLLTYLKNGEDYYRSYKKNLLTLKILPRSDVNDRGELVKTERVSDTTKILKIHLNQCGTELIKKLRDFNPDVQKQLFSEIGDWPQYIRLLNQVGKKRIDEYLKVQGPFEKPEITVPTI